MQGAARCTCCLGPAPNAAMLCSTVAGWAGCLLDLMCCGRAAVQQGAAPASSTLPLSPPVPASPAPFPWKTPSCHIAAPRMLWPAGVVTIARVTVVNQGEAAASISQTLNGRLFKRGAAKWGVGKFAPLGALAATGFVVKGALRVKLKLVC